MCFGENGVGIGVPAELKGVATVHGQNMDYDFFYPFTCGNWSFLWLAGV